MHAYTSSEELALLPANRTSYARRSAPAFNLLTRIKAFLQRQASMREIAGLSDRELHDIGLNRSDLAHVFDQAFARRPE